MALFARRPILLLTLLVALSGCAPAHLASTWRAPDRPPEAVGELIVFGVADHEKVRRAYEDGFVDTLRGLGASARAGHPLVNGGGLGRTDEVERAVRRSGADAVLVTHLIGGNGESPADSLAGRHAIQTDDLDLYSYYSRIHGEVKTPGYYRDFRELRLETNVYDARGEQLLWSGRSAPLDPDSEQPIGEVIDRFILQMRADGLLGQRQGTVQ